MSKVLLIKLLLVWTLTAVVSMGVFASNVLLPSPEDSDWKSYFLKLLLSLAIIVFGWVINKVVTIWDRHMKDYKKDKERNAELFEKMNQALSGVLYELKSDRSINKQAIDDVNYLKKKTGRLEHWQNEHRILHATCQVCPKE